MKNFTSHSPGAVIGFFIQWKESATPSEASFPTFSRVWPFVSMVIGLEGEGEMSMGWGSSQRVVGAGSADTQMLELSRVSCVASGHNPAPLREESWMPSRDGGRGRMAGVRLEGSQKSYSSLPTCAVLKPVIPGV